VSEWDGLEGSFGIFGMWASPVGMPNVPESEGMGAIWVPYQIFISIILLVSIPKMSTTLIITL